MKNAVGDDAVLIGRLITLAVVIPAWRIQAVLDQEHLVKQRKQENEELLRDHATSVAAIPDVAEGNTAFTKADFEQALKKVATKRPDSETTQTSDE